MPMSGSVLSLAPDIVRARSSSIRQRVRTYSRMEDIPRDPSVCCGAFDRQAVNGGACLRCGTPQQHAMHRHVWRRYRTSRGEPPSLRELTLS